MVFIFFNTNLTQVKYYNVRKKLFIIAYKFNIKCQTTPSKPVTLPIQLWPTPLTAHNSLFLLVVYFNSKDVK